MTPKPESGFGMKVKFRGWSPVSGLGSGPNFGVGVGVRFWDVVGVRFRDGGQGQGWVSELSFKVGVGFEARVMQGRVSKQVSRWGQGRISESGFDFGTGVRVEFRDGGWGWISAPKPKT